MVTSPSWIQDLKCTHYCSNAWERGQSYRSIRGGLHGPGLEEAQIFTHILLAWAQSCDHSRNGGWEMPKEKGRAGLGRQPPGHCWTSLLYLFTFETRNCIIQNNKMTKCEKTRVWSGLTAASFQSTWMVFDSMIKVANCISEESIDY